jgi:hypothetical protein
VVCAGLLKARLVLSDGAAKRSKLGTSPVSVESLVSCVSEGTDGGAMAASQ